MAFSKESRYNFYDVIYNEAINDYSIGLGYQNLPEFDESPYDIYYVIESQYAYRPDLISQRFYNTPFLWWVIIKANNLEHPIKSLEAGKTIRIPDYQLVSMEL